MGLSPNAKNLIKAQPARIDPYNEGILAVKRQNPNLSDEEAAQIFFSSIEPSLAASNRGRIAAAEDFYNKTGIRVTPTIEHRIKRGVLLYDDLDDVPEGYEPTITVIEDTKPSAIIGGLTDPFNFGGLRSNDKVRVEHQPIREVGELASEIILFGGLEAPARRLFSKLPFIGKTTGKLAQRRLADASLGAAEAGLDAALDPNATKEDVVANTLIGGALGGVAEDVVKAGAKSLEAIPKFLRDMFRVDDSLSTLASPVKKPLSKGTPQKAFIKQRIITPDGQPVYINPNALEADRNLLMREEELGRLLDAEGIDLTSELSDIDRKIAELEASGTPKEYLEGLKQERDSLFDKLEGVANDANRIDEIVTQSPIPSNIKHKMEMENLRSKIFDLHRESKALNQKLSAARKQMAIEQGVSPDDFTETVIGQIADEPEDIADLDALVTPPETGNVAENIPISEKLKRGFKGVSDAAKNRLFPKDNPDDIRIRKFIQRVKEDPKFKEDLREQLRGEYEIQSLVSIDDEAAREIEEQGLEAVKQDLFIEGKLGNAIDVAKGIRVLKELNEQGRIDEAVDFAERLAEEGTELGRSVNAFRLLSHLSPEGALVKANRILSKNKKIGKGITSLTPEKAQQIVDIAERAQQAQTRNEQVFWGALLQREFASLEPITTGGQLRKLQVISLLLNPKTSLRNALGNSIFGILDTAAQVPAVAVDNVIARFTGQRSVGLPSPIAGLKGGLRGYHEALRDISLGINTQGLETKFSLPQQVSSGPLGVFEKLLNLELRVPDRIAYQAAFDDSLTEQLRLLGVISPEDFSKLSIQEQEMVLAQARLDALYRTFQDDSLLSQISVGMQRAGNAGADFGLGSLVLPFPKTPANLIDRAIDYSPLGLMKLLLNVGQNALNGKPFDQRSFSKAVARAATGTAALSGTGAFLASQGIISPPQDSSPNVREAREAIGVPPNSINVTALTRLAFGKDPTPQPGDIWIDVSPLQPVAPGLIAGSNLFYGFTDDSGPTDEATSAGLEALSSAAMGANTLADQGLLQGVQTTFGTRDEAGNFNIFSGLQRMAGQSLAQFVPTFLSQVGQKMDNTQRDTRATDLTGTLFNQAINRIPKLREVLPERIAVTGEVKERYKGNSNNIFNVFFNPFFVSEQENDPLLNELLRLYETTGASKQLLTKVRSTESIGGEQIKLSPEDQADLQFLEGQLGTTILNRVIESPTYEVLSDEKRVELLSGVKRDVNKASKVILFQLIDEEDPLSVLDTMLENRQVTISQYLLIDAILNDDIDGIATIIETRALDNLKEELENE